MNKNENYNKEESVEIVVLFAGYSKVEESHMKANCTCTLIKLKDIKQLNIIVDTMTAWDGEKLKSALKAHNLTGEDIDYVICTHGHSDHIGCNYLFPKALHIVGFAVSSEDIYFDKCLQSGKTWQITDEVMVIPTPGHTLQDVSVIVKTENRGIVAITGDLFEKEEDLADESIWKDAGSDSEDMQKENRAKILRMADWIIPGHGPMFKVPK